MIDVVRTAGRWWYIDRDRGVWRVVRVLDVERDEITVSALVLGQATFPESELLHQLLAVRCALQLDYATEGLDQLRDEVNAARKFLPIPLQTPVARPMWEMAEQLRPITESEPR